MYGYVITKFSGMGRLPHFLSYRAPPTRGALRRAWSSAITDSCTQLFGTMENSLKEFSIESPTWKNTSEFEQAVGFRGFRTGGGGTILGGQFWNAQNVRGVEILRHRTGLLC